MFQKLLYHLKCTRFFRKFDIISLSSNLTNSHSNDLRF